MVYMPKGCEFLSVSILIMIIGIEISNFPKRHSVLHLKGFTKEHIIIINRGDSPAKLRER
jgi:hypothetical protein